MNFDPTPVRVTVKRVILLKDHCIQVPWKCIKVCGYNNHIFAEHDMHTSHLRPVLTKVARKLKKIWLIEHLKNQQEIKKFVKEIMGFGPQIR